MMNKHAALESIQFQKSDLFNELTACIAKMRDKGTVKNKNFYDTAKVKELSDIIGVLSQIGDLHSRLDYQAVTVFFSASRGIFHSFSVVITAIGAIVRVQIDMFCETYSA